MGSQGRKQARKNEDIEALADAMRALKNLTAVLSIYKEVHYQICYILIFHKTEVQTVILRWITGLNLNWFKSYGLKCNLRPKASSANSQKRATDKRPFYDHIWSFFCQPHGYLSQNWNSNGHFEVLNGSESQLDQKLGHNISSK